MGANANDRRKKEALEAAEKALIQARRELDERRTKLLALRRELAGVRIEPEGGRLVWHADGIDLDLGMPPLELAGGDLAGFYAGVLDRVRLALDHASAENVALALGDAADKVRASEGGHDAACATAGGRRPRISVCRRPGAGRARARSRLSKAPVAGCGTCRATAEGEK